MKVGQTIQKIGNINPSNFVKLANILGFEHLEFDPTVFEDVEAIIPMVKGKSVTLHAPFYSWWGYDLSSLAQRSKVQEYIDNLIKYSKLLGAHSVVVHPPMDPQADSEYFIENLNQIPITIYLENLPGQKLEDFEKWYLETKAKTTANCEICFDVPHSFLTHGKEKLFDIPPSLIPDIHYIHISELSSDRDCHWPFGTPGGELPYDKFVEFVKKIKFNGTINMEMMPADLMGISNLIYSYLKLKKINQYCNYLRKKIRIAFVKPIIMRKLKAVPLQAGPEKHIK